MPERTDGRTFTVADCRRLQAGDVAPLRTMLALFGEVFAEPETYAGRQPSDEYLEGLLSGSSFIAVAAYRGAQMVGGLAGYVLPKFEQARSEFYIYDLAVHEAHRRQGAATALIEMLKTIAAERGIYVIYVQADAGDDAAVALYSTLGRREDVVHFDIEPARRGG